MSRPYSDQFRLSLHKKKKKNIGVRLAKLCVRTDLPSQYVAKIFGVSRMTIYTWFRGGQTSHKNITRIKHFIELVEQDLKSGVFRPGKKEAAKTYLNTNIEPNLIRVLKGGVFRPANKEKENQKKVSKEEKSLMKMTKEELVYHIDQKYEEIFELESQLAGNDGYDIRSSIQEQFIEELRASGEEDLPQRIYDDEIEDDEIEDELDDDEIKF